MNLILDVALTHVRSRARQTPRKFATVSRLISATGAQRWT